jgi:hypothetical protein
LPNITSKAELLDILELLYRVAKHSLTLPAHHLETQEVVHRNMRMGIGLTGILQATEEQLSWLDEAYKYLREFDLTYSEEQGLPPSIKLTTVKPSGTLSLLPGVTPGIHPAYARYMYRRIRMAAQHPLVSVCRNHGYPVEYVQNFDGSEDYTTVVVTFPFRYPDSATVASDMTAIRQLEWIRRLQQEWSDNSVSCTVYYKPEELPEIRRYLKQYYANSFKTLSFMLHQNHGFKQAPFEEVTKEQYDELVARTKPIVTLNVGFEEDLDSTAECDGGACPVR